MRSRAAALLFLLALFAHLAAPAPVTGQTLASIAAVATTATATTQKAGCWGCAQDFMGYTYCVTGAASGFFNCVDGPWWHPNCGSSSPGCGQGAMLPLDPDGAVQYVSRGEAAGLTNALEQVGDAVRRNCEGVIVARFQAPEDISAIRASTAAIAL